MAKRRKPSKGSAATAIVIAPASRPIVPPGDGNQRLPPPAPSTPSPPSNDRIAKVRADRDATAARLGALGVRLREVEADAEARRNLASALTKTLQDLRRGNEGLAKRLEIAEAEVRELRRYGEDLQGARMVADESRARTEAELAASERARSETEILLRDLKEELRSLRRHIEALGKERDEALLRRTDAVRSAVTSIRNLILEEL